MAGTRHRGGLEILSRLSGLSAWSLIVFGILSLLFSALSGAIAGLFIGAALLGHGIGEAYLRHRLSKGGDLRSARSLAWNQAALAGSVLLYLAWQAYSLDEGSLATMLARDPVYSVLTLAPPELAEILVEELPRILTIIYSVAALLVVLSCAGMAALYLRSGRSAGL